MPFMESINSLFGKTIEAKTKNIIAKSDSDTKPDIQDITPKCIESTPEPSEEIIPSIPAKSPYRSHGKLISGKIISLPCPEEPSTKSTLQDHRYSTGSGGSRPRETRMSGGELILGKRFRNGSTANTSSDVGVGEREVFEDEVSGGKRDFEKSRFFLQGNPMLEVDPRGKGKMRLVMDERSYASRPAPASSSLTSTIPVRRHEIPENIDPEVQPQNSSEAEYSASKAQGAEVDLTNLSTTSPETLFELLISFHADIHLQNEETPFSISQLTAIEEFLSYTSTLALLSSNNISNAGVGGFEVMRRVHDEVMASPSSPLMLGASRSASQNRPAGISPRLRRTRRRITDEDRLSFSSGDTEPEWKMKHRARGSADSGIDMSIFPEHTSGTKEETVRTDRENTSDERSLRDIVSSGLYDPFSGPSPPPSPKAHLSPPHPAYPGVPLPVSYQPSSYAFQDLQSNSVGFTPSEIMLACEDLLHIKGTDFRSADLVRVEREVVQHALAWRYLVQRFVVGREELSESLIQETHEILMSGIPLQPQAFDSHYEEIDEEEKEVSVWERCAGVYRTANITNITVFFSSSPCLVPRKMEKLVREFNESVKEAEERRIIDPIALAAEFHYRFVGIHPFVDGNGRVARMVVNAVLLRFVGIVVPFGFEQEDRDEYRKIIGSARLTGRQWEDESGDEEDGGDGDQGDEKPWADLATLILSRCVAVIEGVWDVLGDEDIVGVVPGWEELLIDEYLVESDGEETLWEDDVLAYYLEGEDEQQPHEVMQDECESKRSLVVWRNPLPRRRRPHVHVLKHLAVPRWDLERVRREARCSELGATQTPFSVFETKAADLMTGRGFVAPRVHSKQNGSKRK